MPSVASEAPELTKVGPEGKEGRYPLGEGCQDEELVKKRAKAEGERIFGHLKNHVEPTSKCFKYQAFIDYLASPSYTNYFMQFKSPRTGLTSR